MSITLAGRESESLTFTSSTEELPPGKTKLTLFCPVSLLTLLSNSIHLSLQTSTTGTYLFDSSEIRVSRLALQRSHRKTADKHVLVHIPKDIMALDVSVQQPHHSRSSRSCMCYTSHYYCSRTWQTSGNFAFSICGKKSCSHSCRKAIRIFHHILHWQSRLAQW